MVKVISLSNKAYFTLKAMKTGDDSFSDVVLRMSEKKKPSIMDLAGKWSGGKEEAKRINKILSIERRNVKAREVFPV